MEEYSSVQGCCKAYESPELRVVRVVRDGFLSASEPHLVGYVGGELFGVEGNSWGGLDGLVGPESFDIYGGLDYGGFSGGLSGESFGVDGSQWGGLGSGAEALMMGEGASSYGGFSAGEPSAEGLSAGDGGWTWD